MSAATNGQLLAFHKYLTALPTSEAHWLVSDQIVHPDSEPTRRKRREVSARLGFDVTPWMFRWAKVMLSTPWIFCHHCGEFTTALDGNMHTVCECWDDPDRALPAEWFDEVPT